MKPILALAIALATTSGCIIYDNDGSDAVRERGASADDTGIDTPVENPELPSVTLSFLPPQAEQGESFIGTLTVEEGDLTLSDCHDIVVYGDASVDALIARSDEVLVSVTANDDATPGVVDVLVELTDGTAAWLEGAFTIFPAGSGKSASAWGAENPDALESGVSEECP
jgi:hypothetical protein